MVNIASHFASHIARYFCKTEANSLSQNMVATIIQYDTFRPRLVTYRENLPINSISLDLNEQVMIHEKKHIASFTRHSQ